MTKNAVINSSSTLLEKFLDATIFVILVASVIIVAFFYDKLPDIIPTHIDLNGNIDGHGNKATLFILPAILIPTALTLWWLKRYPKLFNYPVKITIENEEIQYRMARIFVSIINLLTAILFLIIELFSINLAVNNTSSKSSLWLILTYSAIIVLSIPIYIFKAKKHK